MRAALALDDGRVFAGTSFAAEGITCGEIVFNTSMTGDWSEADLVARAREFPGLVGRDPVREVTCAAEFEAYTPYYYSTYESEDESRAGS